MKILSLTRNWNEQNSNLLQSNRSSYKLNTLSSDTVTFKGKNVMASKNIFEGLLDKIDGNLGEEVKELMSNNVSRGIFLTTLVAISAKVTKLIMNNENKNKNESESNDTNKETSVDKGASSTGNCINNENGESDGKTDGNTGVQSPSKPKRTRTVLNTNEEELKAKIQELANKGYTAKEIQNELGFKSVSSVYNYLKKFKIQLGNTSAKTGNVDGNSSRTVERSSSSAVDANGSKTDNLTDEEKITNLINANPKRAEYINNLKQYPQLAVKYNEMLKNFALNPDNKEYKEALEGMEMIWGFVTNGLPQRFMKQYLNNFEANYSSNMDKVGMIFYNKQPVTTIQEYMADFNANKYSEEDINNWCKMPAFTYEEFKMTESLPEKNRLAIYELKKEGTLKFKLIEDEYRHNYKYLLNFSDKIPLTKKLQLMSNFHEALYDNIVLSKDTGTKVDKYFDLINELELLLKKDKSYESILNVMKYILPEDFENIEYNINNCKTYEEVENLNNSVKYKIKKSLESLDTVRNTRVQEIEDVINDNELFKGLIENNHGKLRFISRFVLNKDINDEELYNKASDAINYLECDLSKKVNEGCTLFPSTTNGISAPSFYLYKSTLGDSIKIILNNQGQIHTIYKEAKSRNV